MPCTVIETELRLVDWIEGSTTYGNKQNGIWQEQHISTAVIPNQRGSSVKLKTNWFLCLHFHSPTILEYDPGVQLVHVLDPDCARYWPGSHIKAAIRKRQTKINTGVKFTVLQEVSMQQAFLKKTQFTCSHIMAPSKLLDISPGQVAFERLGE